MLENVRIDYKGTGKVSFFPKMEEFYGYTVKVTTLTCNAIVGLVRFQIGNKLCFECSLK